MIRFLVIVFLSVAGGVVAALTFAVTIGPNAGFRALTLPAVAQIGCFFGGLAGLVISPLMVWALHDKKLWVAVPFIYCLACVAVIVLNILSVRFSEFIALGITVVALFLYGLLGKKYPHLSVSSEDD